ncbi:sugar ABC transporter ATP-binding protein [Treponema sp. SP13]|uniref:sugar ABC transporter ATP-binding protein n=1 Tax=Treponema sp. SP13 TaxID=2789742 RepID=UPI003D8D9A6D
MDNFILELKHIVKKFPGTLALDNVNLQILPGEVHALVGENGAGKSTLMKIITGIHKPTAGEIRFCGKKYSFMTPAKALEIGISMIPQELNPILNMTIAENIFLHREAMKYRFFTDTAAQERKTSEILQKFNLPFIPSAKMKELSIAQMQMVEIAKAVSYDSRIVIMDEPTSSLDAGETQHLFEIIKDLKRKNISVIYISHRLEEIGEICDRLTVFRDGKYIGTRPVKDIAREEIIKMMVGRTIEHNRKSSGTVLGAEVLSVRNLSKKGIFSDISFSVREGEIVGFSGLVGAGRSEIMKTIFGLDKSDSGSVFLYGEKIDVKNPREAIAKGIAMVTEDRRKYGLVLCRSILENMSLPTLWKGRNPFLALQKEKNDIEKRAKQFSIKAPSIKTLTQNLSGGNQQKVILAKWLMSAPKLLILDEPTRGIDVGARDEIYNLIFQFTKLGMAIILISSDLPEIMWLSDRILVMHEGKLMGEYSREAIKAGKITQEDILNKSFGGC